MVKQKAFLSHNREVERVSKVAILINMAQGVGV